MPKISNLFSQVYNKNKIKEISVLGIGGSPRIGGNSDILLEQVLEGAKSAGAKVDKVILNSLKISPCQECAEMPNDGSCSIDDEMQSVYKKIQEADIVILASPVFFGSLSAQTKIMIDRFQCLWRAKYVLKNGPPLKKKSGVFICVEASKREDFLQNAKSIVKNFFATIDADYKEELFCPGLDEKGSVLKHPDILQKAFDLGKNLCQDFARKTKNK